MGCVFSRGVYPTKSIVAGLGEANNLARAVLFRMILRVSVAHPVVSINSFVDDLAQLTTGEREEVVALNAAKAAQAMTQELSRAGFVVSAKSQVVSNSLVVEKFVLAALPAKGVQAHCNHEAADLGIDVCLAAGRNTTQNSRAKDRARERAANKESGRTKKLRGKTTRRRMVNTSILPQVCYGGPVRGFPPSTLKRLRGRAAKNVGDKEGSAPRRSLRLTISPMPPSASESNNLSCGCSCCCRIRLGAR